MQTPFLKFSLVSLCILLFLRIFVLEFISIIHNFGLPACLVALFYYFNEKNRSSMANLNKYLLTILVPLVVLIVAQKTISGDSEKYHLNESFLSWMILLIYLGGISPLPWYHVSAITSGSYLLFIIRMWLHFGIENVRNDVYIHFLTVVIIIGMIVRTKESLDR